MAAPRTRLNSRRYRRVLLACLATLAISATLTGLLLAVRGQTARAVHGDTRLMVRQAGQQLIRALQSRRGSLTLVRDAFDKAPDLSPGDQAALARSAVTHTRHLSAAGLAPSGGTVVWWTSPNLEARAREHLEDAILQRVRQLKGRRVPATFSVALPSPGSAELLVMLEPQRRGTPGRVLVGVFEVRPLLADFFELTLQQPYPVQVLRDGRLLYQSPHWQPPEQPSTLLTNPLRLDAMRWTLRMQPGTTNVARTIASVQGLFGLFSLLAGASSIGLIWLLAMRAWLLERTVRRRTMALRRTTERLRQLAITDELTGLYNRRFFQERWHWEVKRALRYHRPLGCLMVDVNGFKRINDRLGHHAGDEVLRLVAQALRGNLRQSDILARFGGDEFVVALPETSFDQARAVADKLNDLQIQGSWSDPSLGPVRLSVGLGYVQPGQTPEDALKAADEELYACKHLSRSHDPQPVSH
jgi:diguanylate cyclase (GGDEF)-like protein